MQQLTPNLWNWWSN